MTSVPPPDDSAIFEAAQFVVPREAYEAIDARALIERCRSEGFARASIEANAKGAGGGRIRLTCRVFVAVRLMDAWAQFARSVDAPPDRDLMLDCEAAIQSAAAAVFKARDAHERGGSSGMRPAMG